MDKVITTKVAIIILNYNGWQDTIECLKSLQKIDYPDYQIIVVDNGSADDSVEKIRSWANGVLEVNSEYVKHNPNNKPLYLAEYERKIAENGGIPEFEEELERLPSGRKIVLIKSKDNLGYSAGNNIGIRYAIKKNSEAVLIMNPDVRIESPDTLKKMVECMFFSEDIFVVGPNVIDSEGNRASPLRESSFINECTDPFFSLIRKCFGLKSINYLDSVNSEKPYEVEKVAGCCLLIRASFLKEVGLFDENVFLYCEEPILAAQVKEKRGKLIFIPSVTVKHIHKKPSSYYIKDFFKSRMYYFRKYRKYSKFKLLLFSVIYNNFLIIHSWRRKLFK